MAIDAHKNFAYSTVLTAPSPASSGTSLVVAAGDGAKFPAVPFNATIWQVASLPLTTNAEIVTVTARSTDTLTIVRAQESTSARTIVVGDQIAATITVKTLTDIELNAAFKNAPNVFQFSSSISNSAAAAIFFQIANSSVAAGAEANITTGSGSANAELHSYSSGYTTTRYGLSLASMGELVAPTGNALLIGTGTNNVPIVFGTNNLERLRISAAGGLSLGTTTDPGAGAFILTGILNLGAAGQIAFPATQNPSGNVNTLDDYEEGTWTPVIGGAGGTTGQTYSVQSGTYIKVGQFVSAPFRCDLSNKGTITGVVQIQGLPFTVQAAANVIWTGSLIWANTVGNWVSMIAQNTQATGTTVSIGAIAGAAAVFVNLVTADIANNTILAGTINYRTSA